jgi:hypothetical protein
LRGSGRRSRGPVGRDIAAGLESVRYAGMNFSSSKCGVPRCTTGQCACDCD